MRNLFWVMLFVGPLTAHPLPTLRFDRTVDVRLTAAGVDVRYGLELSEFSIVLDATAQPSASEKAKIQNAKPSEKALEKFYAARKAVVLAENLTARFGSQPLTFRSAAAPEIAPNRDHLEFRFHFHADWPTEAPRGIAAAFTFIDTNFEGQSGKINLTVKTDSALSVDDLIEPGPLRGLSPLDLKPAHEAKLRKLSAQLTLPAKAVAASPALPAAEPVLNGERPALADDLRERGLIALFDRDLGLGILLLLAAAFGIAHAFTPGHGKTMVAAYLVGERGTIAHALVLGLTTTLAHTGSVIAVALILSLLYRDGVPETAQGWLQLTGGLLILIVGLWLFLQRVRGRADHVHLHLNGDHQRFGWGRVLLLGLAGGLIPCWDAVMLLLVAIAAGRLALAVPLLIAFSLGLAAVLVLLGIGVVLAHRAGAKRFADRRWFAYLPILSALLLVGMGLYLARDGVQLLSHAQR